MVTLCPRSPDGQHRVSPATLGGPCSLCGMSQPERAAQRRNLGVTEPITGGNLPIDPRFSTDLTHAQRERLAVLAEELAEAAQVIGKIERHGYLSRDPTDPESETNQDLLLRELAHVFFALEWLVASDLPSDAPGTLDRWREYKARSINRWLHYQQVPPDFSWRFVLAESARGR